MTHTTQHGVQWLMRPAVVAMVGLALAGCGVAGTPGGGPGDGSGVPSAGTDDGVGSITELPGGGGPEGVETATPPPPPPPPPMVVAALPAPEDCVSYNPANLTVAALGRRVDPQGRQPQHEAVRHKGRR